MIEKLPNPCMYASGYTLDLYCDHENPTHSHMMFPHTFIGENFAECAREAKLGGWVIHKATRTATCPKCASVKKNRTSRSKDIFEGIDFTAHKGGIEDDAVARASECGRSDCIADKTCADVEHCIVHCHAGRDGECNWAACPQMRDNEPHRTHRHCPRDRHPDLEY